MSRSQKKNPLVLIGDKSCKKLFNRRFRHQNELDFPSGNAYRKTNCSWDIKELAFGYFKGEDIPEEPCSYQYAMK